MSTAYVMSTEEDIIFEVYEQSTQVTLRAFSVSDFIKLESPAMPPEDMIRLLLRGIQGCLYQTELSQELFIQQFISLLSFNT